MSMIAAPASLIPLRMPYTGNNELPAVSLRENNRTAATRVGATHRKLNILNEGSSWVDKRCGPVHSKGSAASAMKHAPTRNGAQPCMPTAGITSGPMATVAASKAL